VPLLGLRGSFNPDRTSIKTAPSFIFCAAQKTRVDRIFDGFTRSRHKPLTVNEFLEINMQNQLFISSAEALPQEHKRVAVK